MAETTLSDSFPHGSDSIAIIVPTKPTPLIITYKELAHLVSTFQHKLAAFGITPGSAVSIALPNTIEFIVSFLATSWQRAIAAPLNSAYKQEEFEFYIDDLKSALALVPRGEVGRDGAAVRAARRFGAGVAECYWDAERREVVLDIKDEGRLRGKGGVRVESARPDDVALVLHTSGTTGRPKAVCWMRCKCVGCG
jgi:acyl-coenzyme A synthetase/AMP-(fatty) acid ligase